MTLCKSAQVLDVRFDALAGVVGILFELRQALQLQEANTGVLEPGDGPATGVDESIGTEP